MISPFCIRVGWYSCWEAGGRTARRMLGVMMPWVMMSLLARATSLPSMIVGMGVFRRVWCWWTRGVVRTTLGDVASIDVVASPTTLGGWLVPTLGSWRFSRIAVSWSIRYHRSHVFDEIRGDNDGAVGLGEGGDLAVPRIESVGACI